VKTTGGILVAVGAYFLLQRLGLVEVNLFSLLFTYWPGFLVWLGLWILARDKPVIRTLLALGLVLLVLLAAVTPGKPATAHEEYPMKAAYTTGKATLALGVGDFELDSDTPGVLSVAYPRDPGGTSLAAGKVSDTFAFDLVNQGNRLTPSRKWRYHVGLGREIPWELTLDMGVMAADLDLRDLNLRRLEANLGVGDMTLYLGAPRGEVLSDLECGIGGLTISVPRDARVVLEVQGGIKQVRIEGNMTTFEEDDVYVFGPPEGEDFHRIKAEVGMGQVRFITR